MSAGLPVVTTSVAGIPELVRDGDTGLLVRERDSSHLADALERLMGDEELRRRLGHQARLIVQKEFQILATSAQLKSIFEKFRTP